MKKFFSLIMLCTSIISIVNADVSSARTFFSIRPHFLKGSPERISLFRNDLLQERTKCRAAVEAVVYGSVTSHIGSEKLSRYFLQPSSLDGALNVREFNARAECEKPFNSEDFNVNKDLEARNFNIVTRNQSFRSRVCIFPKQTVVGLGLVYKQSLKLNSDGTTEWWFEASLPIENVKNDMGLRERITNRGGGPNRSRGLNGKRHVASMKRALNQDSWKYGKIAPCSLSKTGVADVNLIVGYNYHTAPHAHLASYFGLIVPTGNRPRGKYLFEPIVGNDHHWGIIAGNSIGFALLKRFGWHINWRTEMVANYLFQNHQIRSYDLIGKPWSRYLEVYSGPVQANNALRNDSHYSGSSGINYMTGCFKVKPHYYGQFNTAFLFDRQFYHSDITAELGYNLYARQAESVELVNSRRLNNVAIKAIQGKGRTTEARNIDQNFLRSYVPFDSNYLTISKRTIDLESASHPAVVSHTVYTTVGVTGEYRYGTLTTAVGGSYEFSQHRVNNSLNRWTAWGKFIATF